MSKTFFSIAAPAICLLLVACQPPRQADVQTERRDNAPAAATTATATNKVDPAHAKVPKPVKVFEAMCYRTDAQYSKVVAMAQAMDYPAVPEKMMSILGPMTGGGKGFVVVNDKRKHKVILLGVSDRNTCAVYSSGYDVGAIKKSLADNYHLLQVQRDDTGLQVNEMAIPNGRKKTIGESWEHGMVGLTYAKDDRDDGITIGFVPADTAKTIFR